MNTMRVNTAQNALEIGMEVVTREGDMMGTIAEVGSATFEIARGLFLRKVFSAPASAVVRVEKNRVILSMSRADLEATRKSGHIGTTLGERADGVVHHLKDIADEVTVSHTVPSQR
jgi:preprotein translocase subunit YajC